MRPTSEGWGELTLWTLAERDISLELRGRFLELGSVSPVGHYAAVMPPKFVTDQGEINWAMLDGIAQYLFDLRLYSTLRQAKKRACAYFFAECEKYLEQKKEGCHE